MPDGITPVVTETEPITLQTHRIGAQLTFDDHGMSPYHGVTHCYEPDLDETIGQFDALGLPWTVSNATHWTGKLAAPDQSYDAFNEYKLGVEIEDDVGDMDADFTFRPGFPDATHIDTGDPIGGIPDDLPECIRVQVEATNLEPPEILQLLQRLAEVIDLNPDYFEATPHEWSRIYACEAYSRISRQASEKLTGFDGVLDDIAQFGSAQDGRGEYSWDHEEIEGHYQAVALDPATWRMLLPGQQYGKRLKCYHPKNPRAEASADDPLSFPKLEAQYTSDYDANTAVPWHAYESLQSELRDTVVNALHWAELPTSPEAVSDDAEDQVFIPDEYYEPEVADEPVELQPNRLTELAEETERHVETEFARHDLNRAEFEVVRALADGGDGHYEEVADESETSASSVYRTLQKLPSILKSENGRIQFHDRVTREHVEGIFERLSDTADWAAESIRQVVDEHDIFSSDRENTALKQWMERHGVRLLRERPELTFELSRSTTSREIRKLLRSGLEAAEASSLLTTRFEEAKIKWKDTDGQQHEDFVITRHGHQKRLLGRTPVDMPLW